MGPRNLQALSSLICGAAVCSRQVIGVEGFAATALLLVDLC
jgi:hypothetical protein